VFIPGIRLSLLSARPQRRSPRRAARRARLVDQDVDRRKRGRPVLRHHDILRDVEQVVRQQPGAGCRLRERGEALPVCTERVDCARAQRPAQLGRIVLQLHKRRLPQDALHAQGDRIVERAGDLLSSTVDVGDGLDRRVVGHQKALPHPHVGLREFHTAEPRRLIGDKTDVGLPFSDRLDNGGRAGDRLELKRHVAAAGERARELGRGPANLTGCGIAHRLRRVGAEIGRSRHAGRRKLVGSGRRGACSDDCGRGKGEHSHMRSEPLYSRFASIRRGRVSASGRSTSLSMALLRSPFASTTLWPVASASCATCVALA